MATPRRAGAAGRGVRAAEVSAAPLRPRNRPSAATLHFAYATEMHIDFSRDFPPPLKSHSAAPYHA